MSNGLDLEKNTLTCNQSLGALRQESDISGMAWEAGPNSYGFYAMRLSSSKACS